MLTIIMDGIIYVTFDIDLILVFCRKLIIINVKPKNRIVVVWLSISLYIGAFLYMMSANDRTTRLNRLLPMMSCNAKS